MGSTITEERNYDLKKKNFQIYWDHIHWKVPSEMENGKMTKLLKLSPDLEFIKEIIKRKVRNLKKYTRRSRCRWWVYA